MIKLIGCTVLGIVAVRLILIDVLLLSVVEKLVRVIICPLILHDIFELILLIVIWLKQLKLEILEGTCIRIRELLIKVVTVLKDITNDTALCTVLEDEVIE